MTWLFLRLLLLSYFLISNTEFATFGLRDWDPRDYDVLILWVSEIFRFASIGFSYLYPVGSSTIWLMYGLMYLLSSITLFLILGLTLPVNALMLFLTFLNQFSWSKFSSSSPRFYRASSFFSFASGSWLRPCQYLHYPANPCDSKPRDSSSTLLP